MRDAHRAASSWGHSREPLATNLQSCPVIKRLPSRRCAVTAQRALANFLCSFLALEAPLGQNAGQICGDTALEDQDDYEEKYETEPP